MPPHPLLILLLQTSVHPAFLYVTGSMGLIGFVFAVYSFFRKESREDKQAHAAEQARKFKQLEDSLGQFVDRDALEKRFGTIEDKQKMHGAEQVNQHNTLMEYERKRAELTGEFRGAISRIDEKVHVLEVVPSRVDKLESKLDNLNSQITDLKNGQRDLRNELREDMRSNKGEILEAIKGIRP